MALSDVWFVNFYGTNTPIATDANNAVPTSSLPLADEENGWLQLEVGAFMEFKENFDGVGDVQGGFYLDSQSQFRKFKVELWTLKFPADKYKVDALEAIFRKKQKFFCLYGNGQDPSTYYPEGHHPVGKALEFKLLSKSFDYNKEFAEMDYSFEIRLNKPIVDA